MKRKKEKPFTEEQKKWNRKCSSVRALVEHNFAVIKHQWGYRKTRYKELAKNQTQLFALFALSNLYRSLKVLLRDLIRGRSVFHEPKYIDRL